MLMNSALKKLISIKKSNDENNSNSSVDDGGFVLEIKAEIENKTNEILAIIDILEEVNNTYTERKAALLTAKGGYFMIEAFRKENHISKQSTSHELKILDSVIVQSDRLVKLMDSLIINNLDDYKKALIESLQAPLTAGRMEAVRELHNYFIICFEIFNEVKATIKSEYESIIPEINYYFGYFDISTEDIKNFIELHEISSLEIAKLIDESFYDAYDKVIDDSNSIELNVNEDISFPSELTEQDLSEETVSVYYEMCETEYEL